MQAENAKSATESAGHGPQRHLGVLIIYLIGVLAVIVAAIILTFLIKGSAFFWPLTLFGAVIMVALLSAAALPAIRGRE